MDVIINNPAATPAAPTYQGYGPAYAPYGAPYGAPYHHGPGGLLPGLLLIVGAFLLARFALRRAGMRRSWMGPRPGLSRRDRDASEAGPDARPRWPFWAGGAEDSALQIARERFARSEISAEEYEAIRKGLQDGS